MLLCQLVNMNQFDHLTFRHHFPLLKIKLSHDESEHFPFVYFDNGDNFQFVIILSDC